VENISHHVLKVHFLHFYGISLPSRGRYFNSPLGTNVISYDPSNHLYGPTFI
jgi:hypothetical protein